MSDALQTAIINWLRATSDDAMGMEPGDRHMANETRKEIERLQARVSELERQHEVKDEQFTTMQETYQARVAELEALVKQGVEVVDDFMPALKNHALDDYLRLNDFLVSARQVGD